MDLKGSTRPCPPLSEALTVIAGVEAGDAALERMQALVSQWTLPDRVAGFAAYDAGAVGGLDTTGYFGAVFDGRYVYFCPEQHGDLATHAVILRFDTHGDFKSPSSWHSYDAARTAGLDTRGYYGGVFDGRFVYFIPRQIDQALYHTRLLRFDTHGPFDDPASWDAHDIGPAQSAQSAAFDGRYIYLCPGFVGDPNKEDQHCGRVIRIDTRSDFHDPASYTSADLSDWLGPGARCFDGGAFDGRFIYLAALYSRTAVRYDTRLPFDDRRAWQAIDAGRFGMGMNVGLVFDGTHLYYCPYQHGNVVRFDTRCDFASPDAWECHDATVVNGIRTGGCDGGFFDGRFVWFQPFCMPIDGEAGAYDLHSRYMRYDVTGPFTDPASWRAFDASRTDGLASVGYNAGAFDGRYFYAAPWQQGRDPTGRRRMITHGIVLRTDTLGQGRGAFSLRFCDCGHNGGLNAAAPGPSFIVNTAAGAALGVAAHRAVAPGRRHLAGVYDGRAIKLFIDGRCVAQRQARGALAHSEEPIHVGMLGGQAAPFRGRVLETAIHDVAWSDRAIASHAEAFLNGRPSSVWVRALDGAEDGT